MNQELLDKIALIKEEMREIIDNAEVQERSLTDEEKNQFENKELEIRELSAQIQNTIENNIQNKNTKKMNLRENIAKAMQAITNNRSTEDLQNVAGNVISLRAETQSPEVDAIRGEYATELLEPLQDALIVDKLGIKVITTNKAVVMPSVSNVEATIEGEITELVGQKLEFNKAKVNPVRVGLSLPFSNTAIKEADINLVSYAINLCGKAEAQLINKVMFAPYEINGVKGAFVDADTISGALSYKNIVKLAAKVKKANVIIDGTAAYVVSPEMEAELKSTPKDAGSGLMVLENGMMNGYPVLVSNAVDNYIGFGVFSNFLIQKVGTPDLVVDNLSRSKENITEVNFNDNIAMQTIRQEAFAKLIIA